ncbi:MAG TPA: FAD-binding oxidoreductase [candidate division Zixibacteria bacterium]|nr:FAD-binding oxidoreductase [candidate division Zixibacteria bacterium]
MRPVPGRQRSWWLREALAAEGDPSPRPGLRGDGRADVAIVGGGYTGMWTAYFLTERAPDTRIVLLEQDVCGGGPSGRNGGFVHGWWEDLEYLVRQFGEEAGLALARAADEVVDGVGAFCERHGVDAWYTKAGYLRVNAFPREPNDWDRTVDALRRRGIHDALVPWTAEQVQRVCASPAVRDGLMMPSAASVQPARLARGLRRVLLERGVQIHEGTRVRRIEGHGSAGLRVETDHGTVSADQAVLAVNAWAAGWPGFRHRVLAWGSYMILTEPIADRLAELGWTGGQLLSDSRFTISYFRTTADGRIAFGAGVGAAGFGGSIGPTFTHDRRAVARVTANFRRLFPMLRDVRLEDAWGGPIDVTGNRFPEIGSTHGGRLHFAHGYGGNGVGPAYLAGRILAALVDGRTDADARLPLVGRRQPLLPPEPLRFLGARLVREALVRQDDALDAGREPSLPVRLAARLPRLLGYRIGH